MKDFFAICIFSISVTGMLLPVLYDAYLAHGALIFIYPLLVFMIIDFFKGWR